MTTYGVSYWGRDPRRARKDGARIKAAGFAWVLLPISIERMTFDAAGVADVLSAMQAAGLETRLSLWGPPFGGEGLAPPSRTPLAAALWWAEWATERNPDGLYLDEPLGVHGRDAVEAIAKAATLPVHVYLNPNVGVAPDDETLGRMASIGVDCYDGDLVRAIDDADRLASQHGKPTHIWVRAFRIDRVHTGHPGHQIHRLQKLGVNDIAIWGYPSPGVSCLNNDRPRKVWISVLEGIGAHPATRYAEASA